MEKDPHVVARLAKDRQEENWRFRSFLKRASGPLVRRVNASAEQLGREAEHQMDCTTCGACCRDNWVPVTDQEIHRLAARLKLDDDTFRGRYLVPDDETEGGWAIDARPCPFLQGNVCSVYEDRPDPCRGYPYVGGDIPSRMWGIIERASTCPIVFDMLEQLKTAVRFKRYA